jgi:two-component system phosphate regulon response regulator PhoB
MPEPSTGYRPRRTDVMTDEHILVVDDEPDLVELIRYNLEQEGYRVSAAGSGEEALELVRSDIPDLVVLDLMMPGVDGFEVCSLLRRQERTRSVPIVMLTARDNENDVVRGLETGADDYVTKPFSPRVLNARVAAVLRRKISDGPKDGDTFSVHGISIHPGKHEARVGEEALSLTPAEFKVLHHLARRPGWVFTRQQIVEAVHGPDYVVTDRSVDVLMVGLRKKLGDRGDCVETVRGVGYRFKE